MGSEARALSTYHSLQARFPAILGNRRPVVLGWRLPGRGWWTWYRLRVAEATRERATDLLCAPSTRRRPVFGTSQLTKPSIDNVKVYLPIPVAADDPGLPLRLAPPTLTASQFTPRRGKVVTQNPSGVSLRSIKGRAWVRLQLTWACQRAARYLPVSCRPSRLPS
jgi:hypothetical protein